MAKKCVVNKNEKGEIISVGVQNLDTNPVYSYIDDYLKTSSESELFENVKNNKTLYETAIDNYINSKVSNNQIMRDLDITTKTIFFDTLFELGVPIKFPINEEDYINMKSDIENGITKKDFLSKYKTNGDVFKYLSRDAKVELTDRRVVRETVRSRDIEKEIISSIISDRGKGLSVKELYDKYHLPYGKITQILKMNKAFEIKTEEGVVKSIYANKSRIPYQSSKLERWITGDSNFEIARFIELDADPNVLTYTRDVDPIPYTDAQDRNRKYYPDIKITYIDGRVEVEEIKPFKIVKDGQTIKEMRLKGATDEEIQKKINVSKKLFDIIDNAAIRNDVGLAHYEEKGITFRVLTEKDIDIKLSDYSSLTKLSAKERAQFRKEQALEIENNDIIPSQLYEQLRQQPFINENQALDAYKNIYSDDLNEWKNSDLDC